MRTNFDLPKNIWKLIGIFGALTLFVFSIMCFYTLPTLYEMSEGTHLIDMWFGGYFSSDIYNYLTAIGEKGIKFYLYRQLIIDSIFPMCYATFLGLLIHTLFYLARFDGRSSWMWMLPVFTAFFDYVENMCVYYYLINYPVFMRTFAVSFSTITSIKFILLGFSFYGIYVAYDKYKHRQPYKPRVLFSDFRDF